MNKKETKTYKRLLEKCQEAFLLAIELYNRPTIRYHVEGCAFFICNAWELMLKAKLINDRGIESIYYKDHKDRSISLNDCISKVFTNNKDPLRNNLEKIIELRNTSTHFVTDEYEILYGPLFQVAVKNFDEKIKEFHNIEIRDKIPESYLVLSVKRDLLEPEQIKAKYTPDVIKKLLETQDNLYNEVKDSGDPRYAGLYKTEFVVTKNKKEADLTICIDKDSKSKAKMVKQVQAVENVYPYTVKHAIKEINNKLNRDNIKIFYKDKQRPFNTHDWDIFIKYYGIKDNKDFSYDRSVKNEKVSSYIYSSKTIDLILDALKKDPEHAIETLKAKLTKKKPTPGAKDSKH